MNFADQADLTFLSPAVIHLILSFRTGFSRRGICSSPSPKSRSALRIHTGRLPLFVFSRSPQAQRVHSVIAGLGEHRSTYRADRSSRPPHYRMSSHTESNLPE